MKKKLMLSAGLFVFASFLALIVKAAHGPTTPNPTSPSNAAIQPLTDTQVKQIQKIIHDYLVQNPQVLVEASQAYQDQEFAKAKTKTEQAVVKNAKSLFNAPGSPTVGNPEGDVTVVEFLDYQCAHCREMSTIIDALIKSDRKVRFVVKQLPIFSGPSKYASEAVIAAIKQGPDKFLAFHKALLELPQPLTNERINEAAKKVGLNTEQLQKDMKNKTIDEEINNNFKLAQELGLLGTPAFILGNRNGSHVEYVPGAVTVNNLKQTIAKIRK